MSLFDILGGSEQSTSSSQGANIGYGFDSSQGVSGSSSQSSSTDYGSNIWGPQQNHLTGLWGMAAQMLGLGGMGGGSPWSQGPGSFGGPRGGGGLPGYGDGRNDPTRSYLGGYYPGKQDPNRGWRDYTGFGPGIFGGTGQRFYSPANRQAGRLGSGVRNAQQSLRDLQNPEVDPMMDVYARRIGENFREQIMPALQGGANLGGMRGSSRQGVAEGLAAARAQQQMQDFGAQLYSENQNRKLGAAGAALDAGKAGASLQAQMAPLRAALAFSAPWFNLQQFAGILGSPIMQDLGGVSSSSSSSFGSESSFGENVSFGAESSQGQSSGTGGIMPDINITGIGMPGG